mgnify:CR=1 FL=1
MGKLRDRLWWLLGRNKPPAQEPRPSPPDREPTGSLTDKIQQRVRRVSESLLDNEALTTDLDDSSAQELLDWGLDLGRRIVQGTADVEDDEQAQEAMYPRLRATRNLMHSVNRWIASERQGDRQGSSEALNQIIEQAQIIYGQDFAHPDEEQRARFLQAQSESLTNPSRLISNLRELFTDDDDA